MQTLQVAPIEYVPYQDEMFPEIEAEEAAHRAYLRTPEGELETAMNELSICAEAVLKASDFTPELFQRNYQVKGNQTITYREAFIEMWRMVNWTKENLTGEY